MRVTLNQWRSANGAAQQISAVVSGPLAACRGLGCGVVSASLISLSKAKSRRYQAMGEAPAGPRRALVALRIGPAAAAIVYSGNGVLIDYRAC